MYVLCECVCVSGCRPEPTTHECFASAEMGRKQKKKAKKKTTTARIIKAIQKGEKHVSRLRVRNTLTHRNKNQICNNIWGSRLGTLHNHFCYIAAVSILILILFLIFFFFAFLLFHSRLSYLCHISMMKQTHRAYDCTQNRNGK